MNKNIEVSSLLNKNKLIILGLVALIILTMSSATAAKTAKSISLGDDFSALEGVDSFNANPAGLIERDNNWTFVSDSYGGAWGNFIASSGDDIDLNEAFDIIEDENLASGMDTAFGSSMYYRSFGAGLNANIQGLAYSDFETFDFVLNQDAVDLNEDIDVLEMDINSIGGKGAAYADASLSYGFSLSKERLNALNEDRDSKINDINFGITAHYLQGAVFELQTSITEFKAETVDNELYYSMGEDTEEEIFVRHSKEATAAGYAFDLGMNMRVNDKYQLAFSVMNIGEMEDDNVIDNGVYVKLENESAENPGLYKDLNTDQEISDREAAETLSYTLPRTIRFGASMDYSEDITFYGDYANVSYDGLDDSEHKFAVGAEASWMKILPLRMGLNYSTLRRDIEIPFGIGIHFSSYKVDLGFNDLGALWNANKGVSFGISSRLEF
jgi:hypothetical protein